jgi:hypothetical protein
VPWPANRLTVRRRAVAADSFARALVGAGRRDFRHRGAVLVEVGGVGLAGGGGVAFCPLSQGDDHEEEVTAGVGEHVFLAPARWWGAPGEDPAIGELAEAIGEVGRCRCVAGTR